MQATPRLGVATGCRGAIAGTMAGLEGESEAVNADEIRSDVRLGYFFSRCILLVMRPHVFP